MTHGRGQGRRHAARQSVFPVPDNNYNPIKIFPPVSLLTQSTTPDERLQGFYPSIVIVTRDHANSFERLALSSPS